MKQNVWLFVVLIWLVALPSAWAMGRRPPAAEASPAVENPVLDVGARLPLTGPARPAGGRQAGADQADGVSPPLHLGELIQEALQKNPELYAFQERWKAAKARVWQARSWDDTMVGVDFEGIPRGRADADTAMDQEWMISQKIPFPGKRFLRGRVAAKEAKMAGEDYRAKEREIVSEVKKVYFEYFFREHEVLLHEETKRILERLSKSAEARYATGQVAYHEVLRAHTELATITNEVAKHYQQRDTALARLNALLGRGAPLQIAVEIPERSFAYTRDDLMKLALTHRPELRALGYGVEAAKTDSKSAWLELLPDAQYRIEMRKFAGEGKLREYDQFFGFEVPVLSFFGRVGQIKEKRAESRAAQGLWENMKNMVLFEVQEALAEYESNDRTAGVYRLNVVPQAESAVASALAEYESGRGDFLAVMEAQRALTEFRHHYFEALAMREQSLAELERVVGIELGGGTPK